MMELHIERYNPEYFQGVEFLWQEAFPDDPPWNKAEVAIPAKLAVQPQLFFVALDGDRVIGSIMAGYDGNRGWLYAVAVLNSHRRLGVGTELVRCAEERLRSMGCGKINLQVRTSNAAVIGFYNRLGYEVEERISLGKHLKHGHTRV